MLKRKSLILSVIMQKYVIRLDCLICKIRILSYYQGKLLSISEKKQNYNINSKKQQLTSIITFMNQ